jgi:recombination protein RecA
MATASAVTTARDNALQAAVAQMDKQFGKGAVLRLGSNNTQPVSVISTGSLALDVAVGVGGVPRGRVVEIYGPESSGNTTIALQVIAQAQREGGQALFIDAEHAMDPTYARKLGVNVNDLLVSQPDHGETGPRDRRGHDCEPGSRRMRGGLGGRLGSQG